VLISVIVLTARLFAEGNRLVLALPFALGLGMALPWPFLGAGMKVLPKPGAWMKTVNRVFGVVLLCFAVWYARLAVVGWTGPRGEGAASAADAPRAEGVSVETTPADFESVLAAALAQGKPVFVDCWATWCKNCTAMEATTLSDARVKKALSRFAVVKLDASDVEEFRKLAQFKEVIGLPAYAVFE
jgi:thiol:disulfide interchange protein